MVIDHDRLKDRLGTIIRAKEGKMVNVNATVPFNLHNQRLSTLDPSSSRSASRVDALIEDGGEGLSGGSGGGGGGLAHLSLSRSRSSSRSFQADDSKPNPILNVRLVPNEPVERGRAENRNSIGAMPPTQSAHESPASAPFVIRDTGLLSVSWDD